MKKVMRKILSIVLATSVVMACFTITAFAQTGEAVGVSYSAHVQDIGWQSTVADGATAGTTGQSKRLEALKINLTNAPVGASIAYQVHVQDYGWISPASKDGVLAGTVGQSKRVEAIAIALGGMPGYSVQYQVHVQDIGWMAWTADGNITGTVGQSKRIEAIRIRIVAPAVLGATRVSAITVTPTTMTLTAGGATGTITATVDPSDATNKNVTWSTSDANIATVAGGVVTPIAAGTATITATTEDGEKTATCAVTVTSGGSPIVVTPVSAITVTPTTMILTASGETGTITATVGPSTATNKNVTWSSSNTAVATVANGVVTPVAVGTATITVTTIDGAKTATSNVRVIDTSIFSKGDVEAAEFGVMDFSGVMGYDVGFKLIDAKASDVSKVVVKLYNGTTELATATSDKLLTTYPTADTLSAPFDVFGDFDYAADTSWTYSGWNAAIPVIPTKAEITVTFKNGVVKTVVKNNAPTGDTSIFSKGDVEAAEFGVMDFSGVMGYDVGFKLIDAKASDVSKVVVKLYNGTTELATATSDKLLTTYPTADTLSAPFDVFGDFDYAADTSWTYSGWNAAIPVIPTKAEITVTFKNGVVKTVVKNNAPTGDTSIFS